MPPVEDREGALDLVELVWRAFGYRPFRRQLRWRGGRFAHGLRIP
jgi:hypothetical protein